MRPSMPVSLTPWLVLFVAGCQGLTDTPAPPAGIDDATSHHNVASAGTGTASTRWNGRAQTLLVQRPPAANGQAAASRILTYLSVAQHRAVVAAEGAGKGADRVSISAAVGGASVAVLSSFFPLDVSMLEASHGADLAAMPPHEPEDIAAGDQIGRATGAAVIAQSTTDNYLVLSPGLPPVGPGYWVSSAAPIVRSLYRARPFFLTSQSQLRSPPPPAFGSAAFLQELAEVRLISDTRTPEQLGQAQFWNTSTPPFTAGAINQIAVALITKYRRREGESARILAYANAAAFDAQIACFDTKFAYWFIRPSQADPAITLPIGLPNHPSYPSGHSCITAGIVGVLIEAFPSERAHLESVIADAGRSRVYGGIHYQFDITAGQQIGRAAAELALAGSLD